MFADIQREINEGWNNWKQRNKPVDPKSQRKRKLCPKCAKQGFRVKMDYVGNKHVQYQMTCYNFDVYVCPRCKFEDKVWSRIEGKGKRGTNMGRLYGSK